ncbi:hypothetical protein, partial [Adhaeribacter aerolatus]|uniref:hypothetical protein n=1 Tax=Adhaeribacter aerolatus TaxID=670289 RepID=UPI001C3F8F75
KTKMDSIHFNQETNNISILNDKSWNITIYDIELKPIKSLQLDLKTAYYRIVTLFKVLVDENLIKLAYNDYGNQEIYYYQFDLDGKEILKRILTSNKEDIFLGLNTKNNFDLVFMDEMSIYKSNCSIYKNNEEIIKVNLLEILENDDKDWGGYDYIECLISTNKPFQLAFIAAQPDYGVQGVKIVQINPAKNLELVYDMDDLTFDGAFHNLTFNFSSDKFTLLLYTGGKVGKGKDRDKVTKEYFSICEYSIENPKKPIRIFRTDFGYWGEGDLYTHYLTDSLLCIVRREDLIIFDLNQGKTQEVIERDCDSGFYVSFNIIIYKINQEFKVHKSQNNYC